LKRLNPNIPVSIYHKTVKTLKAKNAKLNLQNFIDGKTNVLLASKAAQVGLDIPEADLGIIASYTGNLNTDIQTRGRFSRYVENKKTLIVCLVAHGTIDTTNTKKKIANNDTDIIVQSLNLIPL
jgi:superfamily II DNA or RNA helicase